MKTIEILDVGQDRYTLKSNFQVLGRMFDNNAETLTIIKPKNEINSACTMIVSCLDKVIDHIAIGDEPINITSNLSQYSTIKVGFSFIRQDGYVKNSEVKKFTFLEAQKPDGFVPVEPEQKATIDYLANYGIVRVEQNGTTVSFYNASNVLVAAVGFSGGKIDSISVNNIAQTIDENKNVNITVPTNTSDLSNDSGFITNTVNNLANYYLKTETYTQSEVNSLIGAIKTIKAEIVAELPTASATTYFNTSKTIYMVANSSTSGTNYYDEYITIRSGVEGSYTYSWENIGSTQVDLTNYVQKTTTIAGVDLQDNITKTELLTALNVEDGAEVNTIESISVNGTAITPDANGNIALPLADSYTGNFGLVRYSPIYTGFSTSGGGYMLFTKQTGGLQARASTGSAQFGLIASSNYDYAVKYAMCDGIGAAWTDAEKLGARTRMGASSRGIARL